MAFLNDLLQQFKNRVPDSMVAGKSCDGQFELASTGAAGPRVQYGYGFWLNDSVFTFLLLLSQF